MVNYKVIPAKSAENDLEGIYMYISTQAFMPMTALKTVENIKNEMHNNLSFSPHYPLVDDDHLASIGVRRMNVKKYAVFFVINEENNIVNVIRVIHGARNWQRILSAET